MKTLARKALRFVGADIVRFHRPLDLSREDDVDPLSVAYLAAIQPVLFKVPLRKCLTFGLTAFVPTLEEASPFIHALNIHKTKGLRCYEGSLLEAFYERYRPRTAGSLFGLDGDSRSVLNELPASGAPLPWRPHPPSELIGMRKSQIYLDNIEHGVVLGADNGDPFYGPVSIRKGRLEISRLIRTFESIKVKGFLLDRTGIDNIRVAILVAGSEWRVMVIGSGQHRLAALAALGYETAVVQLQVNEGLGGIVRREDCDHWPMVRNGLVTETEIRATFDRLFYGRQPACADDWLDYLCKKRDL